MLAKSKLLDKYHILNAEQYEEYPLLTTQMALKGTKFVVENFKTLNIPLEFIWIFFLLMVCVMIVKKPLDMLEKHGFGEKYRF